MAKARGHEDPEIERLGMEIAELLADGFRRGMSHERVFAAAQHGVGKFMLALLGPQAIADFMAGKGRA